MICIGIDQKVCTSSISNQYGDIFMHPVLFSETMPEASSFGILWICVIVRTSPSQNLMIFLFLFSNWVRTLKNPTNCYDISGNLDFQSKNNKVVQPVLSPISVSRPVLWVTWTLSSFWGIYLSDFPHFFHLAELEVPTFSCISIFACYPCAGE